jgi:ferredoxin
MQDQIATARPSKSAGNPSALTINVRMPDGGLISPRGLAGRRLQDLLADFGIPLNLDDACAGGRVRIGKSWHDRLPPPSAEERARLARYADADASYRMLCELVATPDIDGVEIELGHDTLVPQTYWIAG